MKAVCQCRTTEADLRGALRALAPATYTTVQARAEETLLKGIEEFGVLQRAFRRRIEAAHQKQASAAAEFPVIHTERWKQRRAG